MRIEGAFLHSRTARRIIALFVVSALIPLALIVALSADPIGSPQLEAAATAPIADLMRSSSRQRFWRSCSWPY